MKKITGLDDKLLSVNGEEDKANMPTLRAVLRMIGNTRAQSADHARRIARIVRTLSGKETAVELAPEDVKAIKEVFDANPMGIGAFFQGQILEILDEVAKG
jgi:hypothetical protein